MHPDFSKAPPKSWYFPLIYQATFTGAVTLSAQTCRKCYNHTPLSLAAAVVLVGTTAAYHTWYAFPASFCQQAVDTRQDDTREFVNWSGTHKVRPRQLYEPETTEDLQQIVAQCHKTGITQSMQCRPPACGESINGFADARTCMHPSLFISTIIIRQIMFLSHMAA